MGRAHRYHAARRRVPPQLATSGSRRSAAQEYTAARTRFRQAARSAAMRRARLVGIRVRLLGPTTWLVMRSTQQHDFLYEIVCTRARMCELECEGRAWLRVRVRARVRGCGRLAFELVTNDTDGSELIWRRRFRNEAEGRSLELDPDRAVFGRRWRRRRISGGDRGLGHLL